MPIYNGAKFLNTTIEKLDAWTMGRQNDIEIIFVDDGSNDATFDILRKLNKINFSVIHLEKNSGKGAALRAGIRRAHGAYVAFTDADLPYGLEIFDKMLELFKKNSSISFLYGSRGHVLSELDKNYGLVRKIGRLFFSIIARLIVPDVADTQCGVKMFSRKLADLISQKSIINRFAADIEFFAIARANNLIYRDFPVKLTHNKESSVRIIKDTLKMIFDIARIKIKMLFKKYEF